MPSRTPRPPVPAPSSNFPVTGKAAPFSSFPALAALSALLLGACAGSSPFPEPTAKYVEYGERYGYPATLPSLKHGRRLYLNRCSACHTLDRPEKYPPAEWPNLVEDMASNAKANPDQVRDITRYLVSASAALRDTSAPRPMGSPEKARASGPP